MMISKHACIPGDLTLILQGTINTEVLYQTNFEMLEKQIAQAPDSEK